MSVNVEINLRIPRVKEPAKGADGYPINNADVRFIHEATVPSLPQPGSAMRFDIVHGLSLECEVLRTDWSEQQDRFIVSCRYAKRGIPDVEYRALLDDPHWVMRPLV